MNFEKHPRIADGGVAWDEDLVFHMYPSTPLPSKVKDGRPDLFNIVLFAIAFGMSFGAFGVVLIHANVNHIVPPIWAVLGTGFGGSGIILTAAYSIVKR